jgi:phosphoserine phosphatase
MLAAAGLGVAVGPKPVLAAVADAVIVHGGLERVLAFVE